MKSFVKVVNIFLQQPVYRTVQCANLHTIRQQLPKLSCNSCSFKRSAESESYSTRNKLLRQESSFNCASSVRFLSTTLRRNSTKRINNEFDGRVALVTGSTSGIGLGIAETLAARGCSVVLTGLGEQQVIDDIKSQFKQDYAVESHYVYADLAARSEIENMCAEIHEVYPNGIDILINNAGFQHVSSLVKFPEEKWETMINVMLSAPFYLTKYLAPKMKSKGWGRIVNIASAHGVIASPKKSAYVSAKHGIVGLTKVTALELATHGITCNALCPGYVNTPLFQKQVTALQNEMGINYEEAEHVFLEKFHATKECVEVKQLADMVAFLCSDSAAQMTGTSVVMDGGWTAK